MVGGALSQGYISVTHDASLCQLFSVLVCQCSEMFVLLGFNDRRLATPMAEKCGYTHGKEGVE